MSPLSLEGTKIAFHTIAYCGEGAWVYEIPALKIVSKAQTPELAKQAAEAQAARMNEETYEARLNHLKNPAAVNEPAKPAEQRRSKPAKG